MNKKEQISFYKKQRDSAKRMKSVASQNYQLAAQLESEAESALNLLGANSGRTRKGKDVLPEDVQLKLISGLTRDKTA